MWRNDMGKWLAERVMEEMLLLYGRTFDLYRNDIYAVLSESNNNHYCFIRGT